MNEPDKVTNVYLRLLICFLLASAGNILSGQQSPAQEIDFTVPEPGPPACVYRIELLSDAGIPLAGKREKEALRMVAERCRLLSPHNTTPRLVRREKQVFLHLYGPLKPHPGENGTTLLQHFLNRRPQTFFLAVHPQQEELMRQAAVISLIARYELEITHWMESPRTTPPPPLPHLPDSGATTGYMLAEQPGTDEKGTIGYAHLIVQAPEAARCEGLLIDNEGIAEVKFTSTGGVGNREKGVRVRLLPEASARLHRLTLPLSHHKGRIALVSEGSVLAVIPVTEPLSRDFILTGGDTRDILLSLLPPLPCQVKVHPVRE